MTPWTTLATQETAEGPLELRKRGENDFLITIAGRVLMNSVARQSEEQLAKLALARTTKRVLIGGLGMGFTLRAALDTLGPEAKVTVVELNPVIVEWCKTHLNAANRNAIGNPRVTVEVADVRDVIANAKPSSYDAIVLDLYEGPNPQSQKKDDPFYGADAIQKQRVALAPSGTLAVWGENPDPTYTRRIAAAGFGMTMHSITAGGSGGSRHTVYIANRRD